MAGGGCTHRSPAALRRRRLQAIQRSDTRIIQSAIDVKFWAQVPPSCSAVRPASCPGCGAASREPGKSLRVVGHGLRGREVEGPDEPEAAPASRAVLARRYRCLGCGAVLVVVPRGVARGIQYTLDAIGYALALWGYAHRTAERVRRAVSGNRFTDPMWAGRHDPGRSGGMGKRYEAKERERLIDEVRASGEPVRVAAKRLGVPESTALYWMQCARRAEPPKFARAIPVVRESDASLSIEVGGAVIRLDNSFDASLLREVIAVLKEGLA